MTAFESATAFYHACESLKGIEGCAPYTAPGATFEAQSEPLAEMTRVEEYVEWFRGVGTGPLRGCRYDLHASAYDERTRQAVFFGTVEAAHTGDGGPVPPTGQSTSSQYAYVLTMTADNKVEHMVKIWNAPWALRELGWM